MFVTNFFVLKSLLLDYSGTFTYREE
ncbi:uncharacterized protein METZ01_LOCUS52923 [marine metagenome]|uniref:Uncharacterized protein n=1 Tax=marine metagenome TaxID=408172 RepID=A0A381S993_9ZZZZ